MIGLATSSQALPDALTTAERKILMEKLTEMREAAEKSSNERFGTALRAFRDAVKSDTAAHDLYLKCTEKANFTDQKRSSQEFRDWKRRHKDSKDTPEFRRALQHQLSWLLLTIEASADPDEIESLGRRALEKVDAIIKDDEKLKDHRGMLSQDVLGSVYAKAYNINGLKAKDWPKSPLDISDIYEKLVFPPLRNANSISQLRGAWRKRIEHEGTMMKNWSKVPDSGKIGMKKDMLAPAFVKWQEEKYPEMLWEQEMDCYNAGDQKQAATYMLIHLGKHIHHKKSLKWTEQFESLINVGMSDAEAAAEKTPAETE